ncbi:hypothetical protein H8356DRAFT_1008672 [Neocallimastix lanati (nom. inval.)]|uniref:Uncharacterized protein n=1 Tax=Neocallimastix californiae TaxID=1754190 RepID=A0A1Y1ZR13_9FUNG|nr:hypothetical protein H8356DRAFT_1008672 [Neocallimastix sp. JGI-2020a]ORY12670.1 hypothetical protein LY90DRAFT_636890 [Neocallimastix californiae]|eukprot:ORY12670.1 hypothetical protein LY90DRAFT_636890 [Neocallimastix californiae]
MATCSIPKDIWDHLGSNVNKSQYFNPIFSWFVVAYTYYAVGRNSGSIWKYLYYVTSFGLFANVVVIIKEYLYLKNFHINYVMYTVWFETYLYGINEWGFVYINFQKIRSCIPFLKRRFWLVFIYALLVYTLFCRTMIAYYKADEEYDKYIKCHLNIIEDTDITTKSTKFHAFLYIPIGVVELIFILSVMKEYFSEKSNTIKKELSALLHSTLFRTLIISVIYILIAVDVLFEKKGSIDFFRKLLWRVKGIFGIIFLVDLLLLRIDLDTNTIILQKQELNKQKKELAFAGNSNDYDLTINMDSINNNNNNNNFNLSNNSSVCHPLISTNHSRQPSSDSNNNNNSTFISIFNNHDSNENMSPPQEYYINGYSLSNEIGKYNRKLSH